LISAWCRGRCPPHFVEFHLALHRRTASSSVANEERGVPSAVTSVERKALSGTTNRHSGTVALRFAKCVQYDRDAQGTRHFDVHQVDHDPLVLFLERGLDQSS